MRRRVKRRKENSIWERDSMKLFTMLCEYFLCVLVLFSLGQLVNGINLSVIQVMSITIPIILYFYKRKTTWKKDIIICTIYLVLLLGTPFLSSRTYDLTVDGNTYHKTAIAFINSGWNPLGEGIKEYQKTHDDIIKIQESSKADLWVEHYPKATWILAATIYHMTGSIESGKCISFIFMIMLMMISYECLRRILDKRWAFGISILLTLNPIMLSQFFSYYVDGIMGIMFIIECLLLFQLKEKEPVPKELWICLIAIASIFVNLKFTGLLCSGGIAAVFYFYDLWKNRKEKDLKTIFLRITGMFVVVYVIAIFLVGSNSYVKNTIDHHNPLYPIIGKDKVDIVTTMQPKDFNEMSHLKKFVYALFSKTANTTYDDGRPILKNPIKIDRSEIDNLMIADIRIGGGGPWYTLSLLIAFFLSIPTLYYYHKEKKDKKIGKYIGITLLSISLTMILSREYWWARYVPQFYTIPVLAVLLISYVTKDKKAPLLTTGKWILLFIIGVNLTIFLYCNAKQIQTFRDIDRQMYELKQMKDLKVVKSIETYGYDYTLQEKGVRYTIIEEQEGVEYNYVYNGNVKIPIEKE